MALGRADASIFIDIVSDDSRLNRALNRAKREVRQFGREMQQLGSALAVNPIMAGAAVVGGLAARSFANYEKQLNRVVAVTDANSHQMERMNEQAKELGKTTIFSATQAAEGMAYLGMSGFNAEQVLRTMPGVTKLATIGLTNTSQAADIATNILLGFGMEVHNVSKVADIMATAITGSNTDLRKLGVALSYAAPLAQTAGWSLEEATASIMSFSNAGIQGTRAGTSLRNVLNKLTKPTAQAKDIMEHLGLELYDSGGALKSLDDIILEFQPHLHKTGEMLAIFGLRAGPAFIKLARDGVGAFRDAMYDLENSGGKAEELGDQMVDGFYGAWVKFFSAFNTLAVEIGDAIAEPLANVMNYIRTEVIPKVAELAESFKSLPAGVKLAAVGFGALMAMAGPLLWTLGPMVIAFSALNNSFVVTAARAKATRLIIDPLTATFSGLSRAIFGIGTVGIADAKFKPLKDSLEATSLKAKKAQKSVGGIGKAAVESGKKAATGVAIGSNAFAGMSKSIDAITNRASKLDKLASSLDKITSAGVAAGSSMVTMNKRMDVFARRIDTMSRSLERYEGGAAKKVKANKEVKRAVDSVSKATPAAIKSVDNLARSTAAASISMTVASSSTAFAMDVVSGSTAKAAKDVESAAAKKAAANKKAADASINALRSSALATEASKRAATQSMMDAAIIAGAAKKRAKANKEAADISIEALRRIAMIDSSNKQHAAFLDKKKQVAKQAVLDAAIVSAAAQNTAKVKATAAASQIASFNAISKASSVTRRRVTIESALEAMAYMKASEAARKAANARRKYNQDLSGRLHAVGADPRAREGGKIAALTGFTLGESIAERATVAFNKFKESISKLGSPISILSRSGSMLGRVFFGIGAVVGTILSLYFPGFRRSMYEVARGLAGGLTIAAKIAWGALKDLGGWISSVHGKAKELAAESGLETWFQNRADDIQTFSDKLWALARSDVWDNFKNRFKDVEDNTPDFGGDAGFSLFGYHPGMGSAQIPGEAYDAADRRRQRRIDNNNGRIPDSDLVWSSIRIPRREEIIPLPDDTRYNFGTAAEVDPYADDKRSVESWRRQLEAAERQLLNGEIGARQFMEAVNGLNEAVKRDALVEWLQDTGNEAKNAQDFMSGYGETAQRTIKEIKDSFENNLSAVMAGGGDFELLQADAQEIVQFEDWERFRAELAALPVEARTAKDVLDLLNGSMGEQKKSVEEAEAAWRNALSAYDEGTGSQEALNRATTEYADVLNNRKIREKIKEIGVENLTLAQAQEILSGAVEESTDKVVMSLDEAMQAFKDGEISYADLQRSMSDLEEAAAQDRVREYLKNTSKELWTAEGATKAYTGTNQKSVREWRNQAQEAYTAFRTTGRGLDELIAALDGLDQAEQNADLAELIGDAASFDEAKTLIDDFNAGLDDSNDKAQLLRDLFSDIGSSIGGIAGKSINIGANITSAFSVSNLAGGFGIAGAGVGLVTDFIRSRREKREARLEEYKKAKREEGRRKGEVSNEWGGRVSAGEITADEAIAGSSGQWKRYAVNRVDESQRGPGTPVYNPHELDADQIYADYELTKGLSPEGVSARDQAGNNITEWSFAVDDDDREKAAGYEAERFRRQEAASIGRSTLDVGTGLLGSILPEDPTHFLQPWFDKINTDLPFLSEDQFGAGFQQNMMDAFDRVSFSPDKALQAATDWGILKPQNYENDQRAQEINERLAQPGLSKDEDRNLRRELRGLETNPETDEEYQTRARNLFGEDSLYSKRIDEDQLAVWGEQFEVLKMGGLDVATIFNQMSTEIKMQMYESAIAIGVVPTALEDLIKHERDHLAILIRSGQATDKQIERYNKLGEVTFDDLTVDQRILLDGFAELLKALGVDLPASFTALLDSAKPALGGVADELDKVDDIQNDINNEDIQLSVGFKAPDSEEIDAQLGVIAQSVDEEDVALSVTFNGEWNPEQDFPEMHDPSDPNLALVKWDGRWAPREDFPETADPLTVKVRWEATESFHSWLNRQTGGRAGGAPTPPSSNSGDAAREIRGLRSDIRNELPRSIARSARAG